MPLARGSAMEQSLEREQELFTVALAMPPSERAGYLARACGCHSGLEMRVRGLLENVAAVERFSCDQPIIAAEIAQSCPVRVAASSRERIGGYLPLEEIGEGGCAIVYRAREAAPARREVAIKISKPGMDPDTSTVRLAAERQVLAMMQHVGIAKVFGGGGTTDGRPYLAMELVLGICITEYCELSRLTVTERVGLLMQLCRAVQHVHEKGIVHCDIKPANVLVTLRDGLPATMVIDFGIARRADEARCTPGEPLVGTPAYMSPEQTEAGRAVDARSDIYSLGVLLHELLTGSTPQRMESGAKLRQTGGLMQIVMRCLEKDPARRYRSCRDLELGLQRLLLTQLSR